MSPIKIRRAQIVRFVVDAHEHKDLAIGHVAESTLLDQLVEDGILVMDDAPKLIRVTSKYVRFRVRDDDTVTADVDGDVY